MDLRAWRSFRRYSTRPQGPADLFFFFFVGRSQPSQYKGPLRDRIPRPPSCPVSVPATSEEGLTRLLRVQGSTATVEDDHRLRHSSGASTPFATSRPHCSAERKRAAHRRGRRRTCSRTRRHGLTIQSEARAPRTCASPGRTRRNPPHSIRIERGDGAPTTAGFDVDVAPDAGRLRVHHPPNFEVRPPWSGARRTGDPPSRRTNAPTSAPSALLSLAGPALAVALHAARPARAARDGGRDRRGGRSRILGEKALGKSNAGPPP
jgi:hypothetical protein